MPKTRLLEFDIAKAIAFVAVIIGHTSFMGFPKSVVDFCYSFHMPLFFIVSGYFCRPDAKLDVAYVKKNAKVLLIPYATTCCIVIALSAVVTAFVTHGDVLQTVVKWAKASLYGVGGTHPGMPEDVVGIGAIWFLWALFWGKLLLAEINRTPCPFVFSLALFVVGTSTTGIVWLPFAIQNSLCAVLFMHIGQIVRLQDLLHRIPPLLWVCALGTWLYCGAFFGHLYMESNYFQHGAMDIIGGVCGTLCLIKFGEALSRRAPSVARPIAWLGSITLPLFCMHLVELNVIPWDMVTDACVRAGITPWIGAFLLHLAAIAVLCVALRLAPRPISKAFYQ